jgi:hypothetical protein
LRRCGRKSAGGASAADRENVSRETFSPPVCGEELLPVRVKYCARKKGKHFTVAQRDNAVGTECAMVAGGSADSFNLNGGEV